jgi:hypothetical protein
MPDDQRFSFCWAEAFFVPSPRSSAPDRSPRHAHVLSHGLWFVRGRRPQACHHGFSGFWAPIAQNAASSAGFPLFLRIVAEHLDPILLDNREASGAHFDCQGTFMDFLQVSGAERNECGERTADRTFRQIDRHGAIGVNPFVPALKILLRDAADARSRRRPKTIASFAGWHVAWKRRGSRGRKQRFLAQMQADNADAR